MKFSIIVPVYNCINDLPTCISSILGQTESEWELLLVDDGSTDGCAALCDRFAEQDERIRVFHKANGGASSARNTGLQHAVGETILFIDGDDTVESDLLERISAAISDSSPQMVIFGMSFDLYNSGGRLEKAEPFSVKHTGLFSSDEILACFSSFFADNALSSACNKAFSGSIVRNTVLRFSEEMTLYEDLDYVLRYLPFCEKILCLDRAQYHYRLPAEKSHIHQRVLMLDQLLRNLELLIDSMLALDAPETAQTGADLCAQLFDQHLLTAVYSRKELPEVLAAMRESDALRSLSEVGVSPSPSSSPSWSMISRGEAQDLYRSLRKRKLLSKAKQIVKPVLKDLGLYH